MVDSDTFLLISKIVYGFLIIPSILCYMIGEIVLDAIDLFNKDDLYNEITQTKFYTYCIVELTFISVVIVLIVFNIIFSFGEDEDSINLFVLKAFVIPFSVLGIVAPIFTIIIFVEMRDSHCQENLKRVKEFVNNTEWDSDDGQKLRKKFPNATNMSDIYNNAQNWAKEICGKGYITRAVIVGVGGIGFFLFITSPCFFVYYFVFILVFTPNPPHGF